MVATSVSKHLGWLPTLPLRLYQDDHHNNNIGVHRDTSAVATPGHAANTSSSKGAAAN